MSGQSHPTPAHAGTQERPLAGFAANAAGFAAITCGDALTKLTVLAAPVPQILALRSAFLLLFLTPLFVRARRRGEPVLATRHPERHLIRSAVQLFSVVTFFLTMQKLPFTTVVSIMLMTPIFAALSGILLLGERVRPVQAGAIALGLVGCLIIVDPRGADFSWWTLIAISSSLTWGVSQTYVRLLARTEGPAAILAWSNGTFLIAVFAVAVFDWRPLAAAHLAMIFAMAATQLCGQWFTTLAFRLAPVAVVAPAQYSQMLWAILIGLVIFNEWPARHVWIGVALIIAAGVWLLRAERRLRVA